MDSEVLNSMLDYRSLVPSILDLAVRWSGWPVAALLIGNDKTPLTAVTVSDSLWSLTVAAVDFSHRVLHDRTLQTGYFAAFESNGRTTGVTVAIPLLSNDIQAVLLVATDDLYPNLPSVNELMTLLAKQSVAALHNADVYGHIAGLYRKQRQIEAMKDEFVALASHELRTPLTMVIGYTEVLARSLKGADLTQISEIQLNAVRMKQIVDTLSELQISGTPEALVPQEFDVMAMLRQINGQVNERFPRVSIQIQSHLSQLMVNADARWVRVLVSHLLLNAAEHARQERVDVMIQDTLRSDMPEPTTSAGRRWLTITVIDHGIGIADQDQLHLFAPFVQLDDSLTRSSTGSGLGLALVYDIVQRMEGYVWVSSKVGVGSAFVVMIPV